MTRWTASSPSAEDPSSAGAVRAADRQRFALAWAQALTRTSYVPMTGDEVERRLESYTERLVADLVSEPFDSEDARAVGADLVAVHFTGAESLAGTVDVLGEDALRLLGIEDTPEWRQRLSAIQGAVCAGFVQAARKRTLDEQEAIRQAVIDARDSVENALRTSESRFRAIFAEAVLGIGIADIGGRILEVNSSLRRILGRPYDELRRMMVYELTGPDEDDENRDVYEQLVRGDRDQYRVEKQFVRPDGTRVWTEIVVSLVRGEDDLPLYQVAMVEDVTDRKTLQERLRHQAMHDPLTGLPNRALLLDRLDETMRAHRDDERIAVCYMDLDGFKMINDSLGHHIGDDLLVAVADRLAHTVRGSDRLVARMGGDEFVILVEDSTGTEQAVDIAETVLDALGDPIRIGGNELSVGASIGIVERPVEGQDAAELIRDADVTLYWAKSEGKGTWKTFDPVRNASELARFHLSATMPAALEHGEFYVDYQPLVGLRRREVVGVEALVRWWHPDHGRLGPDKFIGLAEETGLIVPLGRWVLGTACRQAKQWADEFGDTAPFVSVNLAVRQLREPRLVSDVAAVLAETGLEAAKLQLELTESAVMGTADEALEPLRRLSEMGVRIAIDDFGTGYSNLAYLRHLPVHELKIAGSFMEGLRNPDEPDPVDARIVRTLVELAHTLGLSVTAEGVETEDQAQRLAAIGCETGQGYYFEKPCLPDRARAFIADHLPQWA
ncbi:EAL domain-containing protein [Allosaccharopolyspora coralli]|uniref:EAL domain-containing protein n=1 Tax=Allosaccharopolyspora coralli TaxID=2665642 RepID=A0A5Q3QJZ9_9PSEU|nr:EAL domain-containing protein [Allosaccharopolyspora coralli]QGK71769.1 EAL domain-containing protein [Allosaccharopolyspora coralli]